ncbi:SDR family oxidoreductase [Pseudomonadota bacterium]
MIGVLSGTGNTGGQVVKALKAKGADFKCIVRNPDAAREKLGADIALAQGDLADPASLDSAFQGLDTLYLLCGHSPSLGDLELNALAAAKNAGISYIVKSSGSEKGITPDAPSEILKMHHKVEEAVKTSGIDWAISRPNFFMSNLLNMAEPVAKMGKLITALPAETKLSMIHPADIGESVAELLINKNYVGDTCFLTGNVISMGDKSSHSGGGGFTICDNCFDLCFPRI